MVRNPLSEGKYVTVLQTVDTTGANPATTTIPGVRQIKRFVGAEMYLAAGGNPTHECRVASGVPIRGNLISLYTTTLAGTPNAVSNQFFITVEVGT